MACCWHSWCCIAGLLHSLSQFVTGEVVSIVILHKILCSVVCGDEGSGGDTELSGCGPATLFRQWTTTKLANHFNARGQYTYAYAMQIKRLQCYYRLACSPCEPLLCMQLRNTSRPLDLYRAHDLAGDSVLLGTKYVSMEVCNTSLLRARAHTSLYACIWKGLGTRL